MIKIIAGLLGVVLSPTLGQLGVDTLVNYKINGIGYYISLFFAFLVFMATCVSFIILGFEDIDDKLEE